VFLLDSKNWTGITSIIDGAPKLNRRHDPEARSSFAAAVRNAVLASSAEISRELRRRTGRSVWVNAIVVFWNEFSDGLNERHPITYVHGSRLLEFLNSKPARLDAAAVEMFAAALLDLQTDRARPTVDGPTPSTAAGTR